MALDRFVRNCYVRIIGIMCMVIVYITSLFEHDSRGAVVSTVFIAVTLTVIRKIRAEKPKDKNTKF